MSDEKPPHKVRATYTKLLGARTAAIEIAFEDIHGAFHVMEVPPKTAEELGRGIVAELRRLEERDDLVARLAKYVYHDESCPVGKGPGLQVCVCGLEQLEMHIFGGLLWRRR